MHCTFVQKFPALGERIQQPTQHAPGECTRHCRARFGQEHPGPSWTQHPYTATTLAVLLCLRRNFNDGHVCNAIDPIRRHPSEVGVPTILQIGNL